MNSRYKSEPRIIPNTTVKSEIVVSLCEADHRFSTIVRDMMPTCKTLFPAKTHQTVILYLEKVKTVLGYIYCMVVRPGMCTCVPLMLQIDFIYRIKVRVHGYVSLNKTDDFRYHF